jgi:hypothetical protein
LQNGMEAGEGGSSSQARVGAVRGLRLRDTADCELAWAHHHHLLG